MRPIREVQAVLGSTGGERGVVLVTALLVMVFLLPLGIIFLQVALTENTIASNEVALAKGFNIAEAGFELAKRTLKTSTAGNLNGFLSGASPGPYPFGSTPGAGNSLDGGNYIVRIYDNNDDADPNNDTDNIVFVDSTDTYGGSQKRLVALVQVPVMGTPDGSLEVVSPDEVEIELKDGAWLDGRDWDPPADPSSCVSIASCGSLTGNPDIAGVSTSSVDIEVEAEGSSLILGTPPEKLNLSLSATPWNDLIDELIPQADRTLTGSQDLTGTYTWGTPAAPEITVISGSNIDIQGVVNGAGMLIIDNAGDLDLDHGTLNWQGLIVVRGSGDLELEFDDDDDSVFRLFGGFVLLPAGSDPQVELEIENSESFVKYSSSALGMVRGAILPMTVLSWREIPM
ncbi:MAG: PilX N-terminal domain-containing pilus assembly protein [Candidatus Methylomirabilales bacterium]